MLEECERPHGHLGRPDAHSESVHGSAGGSAIRPRVRSRLSARSARGYRAKQAYAARQQRTDVRGLLFFSFILHNRFRISFSNEDTDRMVESDPRIVLRPLNPPAHEET